jgi:hypothetical protein
MFSLPKLIFSAPSSPESQDVERLLPAAEIGAQSRPHISLRRRRMVWQVCALGAVLMLGGWMTLGMPDADGMMARVGLSKGESVVQRGFSFDGELFSIVSPSRIPHPFPSNGEVPGR